MAITTIHHETEVLADGTLVTSDSHWWCSGFFSGVLWQLYENTGDELLKEYAENYTARIKKEQYSLIHIV